MSRRSRHSRERRSADEGRQQGSLSALRVFENPPLCAGIQTHDSDNGAVRRLRLDDRCRLPAVQPVCAGSFRGGKDNGHDAAVCPALCSGPDGSGGHELHQHLLQREGGNVCGQGSARCFVPASAGAVLLLLQSEQRRIHPRARDERYGQDRGDDGLEADGPGVERLLPDLYDDSDARHQPEAVSLAAGSGSD